MSEGYRKLCSDFYDLDKPTATVAEIAFFPGWFPIILMPTVNDDNPCHVEFATFMSTNIFRNNTIEFSPLLLASIEAVGDIADFRTVMPAKGQILMRLFLTPDITFSDWVDNEPSSEPTAVPAKIEIRKVVAQQFAKSNLLLNQEEYRSLLARSGAKWPEYEVRVIIQSELDKLLDYYLTFDPDNRDVARRILKDWIAESDNLLQQTIQSVWPFDTQINILKSLGSYAVQYGLRDEARTLLQRIVASNGQFPLSNSVYEGPRKVLLEAKTALIRIDR